jgi:hypothetical protein
MGPNRIPRRESEDEMDRRTLLQRAAGATAFAIGVSALGPRALLAQTATPPAGLASLGLPELTISVDDSGFTVPSQAIAGRVLMTVENTGSKELHFFVVRIPDEISDEQLATDMQGDGDPPWFDMTKLTMAGNPDWPQPGGRAQGVVDLAAGRWLMVDPIDNRDVALMTVAPGTGGSFPDPPADISIALIEMDFTGLEHPVAAGPQVWQIANKGALEHEIAIIPVPADATKESVTKTITDMLQGQGDPASFAPVGGQGIASKGVTTWQLFDLDPGAYAAVCMSPMPGEGFAPHAAHGMVEVFTVQ